MTALADLLGPADRRRLFKHLDQADELDRLMRERGGLPSVPEQVPLHRAGGTKFSTESTTKFSIESTTTSSTTDRATPS